MYFAVHPNLAASNLKIFVTGGLLGALCYATYDLTNLATLKDFSINIVPIDIIWGFVLTGLVALCSAKIYKHEKATYCTVFSYFLLISRTS